MFEEALLTAVFVWQESAVNEVRRLSELNHAGIVLASDWRRGGAHWLKMIFGARGLWPLICGITPMSQQIGLEMNTKPENRWELLEELAAAHDSMLTQLTSKLKTHWGHDPRQRSIEIAAFLLTHPQVRRFVIIDDENMRQDFAQRMIWTREDDIFTPALAAAAQQQLSQDAPLQDLLPKLDPHELEIVRKACSLSSELFCSY